MTLAPGSRLGHYEILALLGAGGMGVVYKARDTKLGRVVALKVLPAERMGDEERRRRFVQEARAASALHHPHIVTVFDIDEADGVHFIAMEHVEGATLADRIGRRGLPLRDALKLAAEIADALAQAHSRGIVHRDLKPANVMVTTEGVAKVLDFGLAKLIETEESGDETTDLKPATDEGTIVGTAAYMSPEQAQGKRVDARSDIFSFGSVLYEMLTGRRAFPGETKVSTLAAILKEEPRPPSDLVPAVPREVDRIIQHCLRKDPSRRFQHIDDVRIVLDQLREDSESGKLAAATPVPRVAPSKAVVAGLGVAVLVLIAGAWLWLDRRPSPPAETPLVATPFTVSPGFEFHPTFSPDGNEVAFAWYGEKRDNLDIYRKLIGPGEPLRLTRDPADDYSPAWSPDGRLIAFLREADRGPTSVYLVAALGGAERHVADVAAAKVSSVSNTFVAWAADGKWLIVSDEPSGEPPGLFRLSPESGEKARITSAPVGRGYGDRDPALSPDGRTLAFTRQVENGIADVHVLPVGPDLAAQGPPVRLTFEGRLAASPAWTPGGDELLFSQGSYASERQILRLAVRARGGGPGPTRSVSVGADAHTLAVSRTSRRLVFSRGREDTDIYRIELKGAGVLAGEPRRLIASTRVDQIPESSPKGDAIAFVSMRSGSEEIWLANADGSNPRQLTSFGGALTSNPRWSPDGASIVFDSRQEGSADLYSVSPQGGAPRRLTDDPAIEHEARWSRDGRWIYFGSDRSGRHEVWRMPAGGGAAVPVTRNGGRDPFESPDGRWLYYAKAAGWSFELWRSPLGGGAETRVLEELTYGFNYVVTSRGIYFLRSGEASPALCFLSSSTGNVTTILGAIRGWTFGLTVSPDERWLLYTVTEASGTDLVLVEDFR